MKLFSIHKKEIWAGFILVALYLISRLISLTILPVFVDEAIYIRWAQILINDPNNRFIPLIDGKQPLFMWLAGPLTEIFTNPLFAARLVSAASGFLGMIGMFFLGRELIGKRFGFLASLLYALTPFVVFYDRLAVPDGLLSALGIWSIYLSILLVRRIRLDAALILGMVIGFATLTKTPGFFYLMLLPFSVLLFDFKKKSWRPDLLKLFGLWSLVFVISFGMYNILRLSPLFYLISQRQPDFVFSIGEVINHPLDPFIPRLGEIFIWLGNYLTWPVFILVMVGFVFWAKVKFQLAIYLLLFSLIPLLIEAQIAKGFTPRYFIFTAPPLILLASYAVVKLLDANKKWVNFSLVALATPAILFDLFLITNPAKAEIPVKERSGYLEEWSAGHGIFETAQYLISNYPTQPVLVGTEGSFGTLPDGLMIYLTNYPNITIVGMGQPAAIHKLPQTLIDNAKDKPTFLVVNKSRLEEPDDPHIQLVAQYPKAKNSKGQQDALLLLKINNEVLKN